MLMLKRYNGNNSKLYIFILFEQQLNFHISEIKIHFKTFNFNYEIF